MSTTPLIPIVKGVFLTTSWETLHTVSSPSNRIGVDAACFNNISSNSESYSVRIVYSDPAAVNNELITNKAIRAERNDLAPGLIGQSIDVGGSIQAKSSVDNTITAHITATEVT